MMGAGLGAQTASLINGIVMDNLTATGNSQQTALQLTGDVNVASVVTANSGVMLPPAPQPGDEIVVTNLGASTLLVYPYLGATIQGAAANVPYTLVTGASVAFIARKGTGAWIALSSAGNVVVAPSINAPILTQTSAAGTPPYTFDETIDATDYAGYRRRLQVASDSGFTTVLQDLYKLILEDEINGTSADWSSGAFNPSRDYSTDVITGLTITWPGTRYFRERLERDDGTNSAWSNTINDTYNSTALTTVNGTSKHTNVTVSGSPALNGQTASFDGNVQMVRADHSAAGPRQFEATVTAIPSTNHAFVIGIDANTDNFGQTASPEPGNNDNTGVTLSIFPTGSGFGWNIAKGGTFNSQSGATNIAINDVVTVRFDTVAGTISFYKNGTQLGTTITGLGTITTPAWAVFGCDGNGVSWTSNFGGSSFTLALSGGYQGYQT